MALPPLKSCLNKTKQNSNSPSSTPFTRSKSQIYLHHNRSGRVRRDAAADKLIIHLPDSHSGRARRGTDKPVNLSDPLPSSQDIIPIKDLRARRVFSTGPSNSNGPNIDEEMNSLKKPGGSNLGSPDSGNGAVEILNESVEKEPVNTPLKLVLNEEEALNNGVVSDTTNQTQGSNPASKKVINLHPRGKVFKTPNIYSYRRLLPFLEANSKDESIKSKPHSSKKHKRRAQSPGPNNNLATSHGSNKSAEILSEGSKNGKSDVSSDFVSGSDSKSKRVKTSRSKGKVFKAPNIYSYRRLLPFLNNSDSTIKHEAIPMQIDEQSNEINEPTAQIEARLDDSAVTNNSLALIISEKEVSIVQTTSKKESMIRNYFLAPEKLPKMVTDPSSKLKLLPYITNSSETSETSETTLGEKVAALLWEPRYVQSNGFEEKGINGILKGKNPKGCRGKCNCLNCGVFRLNAEKAFEFSKNQFSEAEEISNELIKELSDIRKLLENNDFCVSKVQELCKKAMETERIAKERISEMKEDLYVHCRTKSLNRPTVTFTDIEEK